MPKIYVNNQEPSSSNIKALIRSLDYDRLDQEALLFRNTRNAVYEVLDPSLGRELILKRSRPSDKYTIDRKISHYLRNFFKYYGRKAFRGALILSKHGIPTITPIAYWKIKVGFLQYESCFLYKKIDADYSILNFAEQNLVDLQSKAHLDTMLDEMCDLMRKIHQQDILHRDMIRSNFLVKEKEEGVSERRMYVIDTDHVGYNYAPTKFLKRIFALRCMCRVSFQGQDRQDFIKRYLQDDYSDFWFKVFQFWCFWDRRPLRKIRWRLKKICGLKNSRV